VLGRIYKELFFDGQNLAGYRIDIADFLYAIAKKFDSNRKRFIREVQLNYVPTNPEFAPLKVDVISGVLQVCKSA